MISQQRHTPSPAPHYLNPQLLGAKRAMMLVHLAMASLVLAAAAAASDAESQHGETSTSSRTGPIAVFSPSSTTINNVAANQTTIPAIMMPEAKRVPDGATMWSPSPPPSGTSADLAPIMMHHQLTMPPAATPQPQSAYPAAAVAHSPPPPPPPPYQQPVPPQQSLPQQQQQHLLPANYHQFFDDEFSGTQYGPPPPPPPPVGSNEYRSEHYGSSYPPFEQPQPSYPLLQQQQQQQQLDSSLIPTAKHFVLVSFIGLLLLFAIIQNSISTARRKDALVEVLSNRKKRDVALRSFNEMTPDLSAALKEDARVRCIQRTLCYETRKLHEDLGGIFGNLLGKYLAHNVARSLQEFSPGWDRLVQDAADAGSRGDDCDILYRDCSSSSSSSSSSPQTHFR